LVAFSIPISVVTPSFAAINNQKYASERTPSGFFGTFVFFTNSSHGNMRDGLVLWDVWPSKRSSAVDIVLWPVRNALTLFPVWDFMMDLRELTDSGILDQER
jgi:hypothetical protein